MQDQVSDLRETTGQLSDILLVLDKQKMKIQAVKGIGKDGELETVEPNKRNENQFLRVDRQGDLFSNFFSNFISQLKNPSRFSFFKVPASESVEKARGMQEHINNPTMEGAKLMVEHEVKPGPQKTQKQENPDSQKQENQNSQKQENRNNMETTQTPAQNGEYRYKPEQIDWETMSNLGLSKERLEKMKLLDPLLRGYKTNELVPVSVNFGSAITRMDARLSLQPGEDGKAVMAIHGMRKEPTLNLPFFGHEFTKEDKENLLKTGNMGRIVDLTNLKTGEQIPSIISVDRLTNELIALRADKIKIPDEIKGVKLDDQQKKTLMEGKPLYLEGMTSKKGQPFNAEVQFNADKRYVEFLFGDRASQQQQQNQASGQREAPRTIRGKELNDEQYQKFKEGQTVYVPDLKDKQGKTYKGYLTFNQETSKVGFSFSNPNKLKDKIQPAEEHKTQIAVNSEGKTNESTKNIKEPLKSGQKNPDNKKQQDEQKASDAPARSRRRKM